MLRLTKQLQEFIASSSDFRILYSCGNSSPTMRIFILDSSYNPPHLGHLNLINHALRFNRLEDDSQRLIMLLLSVNNADKKIPHPESFGNRLEMMSLMVKEIRNQHPNIGQINLAVTKHAKFVDKSVSIIDYLKSCNCYQNQPLTFLLGFDTLVRLLDPKYYVPDKLSDSLEDFMNTTNLFCLTRNFDNSSLSIQSNYISEIKAGKHPHIPCHWTNNILVVDNNDPEFIDISSSAIRNQINKGNSAWQLNIIPQIKDMIISDNFYQEDHNNTECKNGTT